MGRYSTSPEGLEKIRQRSEKIIEYRKQGYSKETISELMEISLDTVYRTLKAANFPMLPRGDKKGNKHIMRRREITIPDEHINTMPELMKVASLQKNGKNYGEIVAAGISPEMIKTIAKKAPKIDRAGCTGCVHWRPIYENGSCAGMLVCHYTLDNTEGETRRCPPGAKCNKKKLRRNKESSLK
jgi:predicted RNA-binding protein